MTRFRPCIDLHDGQVKQIVGSSLSEKPDALKTNFVSTRPSSYYAELYQRDGLKGGHVIMLGRGNEQVAKEALQAYPGGFQIGGGIKPENAVPYLEAGASHVIVTSYVFDEEGVFSEPKLAAMVKAVGRERLVLDLSCRATEDGWVVAMNRWQTLTNLAVNDATFSYLSPFCDEFLIHAVDVEGKCEGIDEALVERLAEWSGLPVTYAGGARNMADLQRVQELSQGRVDVTIGSALDIFGGTSAKYGDCVAFNQKASKR